MNTTNQPANEPHDEGIAHSDTSEQPPPLWTDSESVGSSLPSLYGDTASLTTDDNQNLDGFESDSEGSDGAPFLEDDDLEPGGADTTEDASETIPLDGDSAPPSSAHVLRGGDPDRHCLLLALLALIMEECLREGLITPSSILWNDDFGF